MGFHIVVYQRWEFRENLDFFELLEGVDNAEFRVVFRDAFDVVDDVTSLHDLNLDGRLTQLFAVSGEDSSPVHTGVADFGQGGDVFGDDRAEQFLDVFYRGIGVFDDVVEDRDDNRAGVAGEDSVDLRSDAKRMMNIRFAGVFPNLPTV